jgi:outer membrane biosynthesis protein TonB
MSAASRRSDESRIYRDAGSWWRFAPAVALSAALHGALLFPEHVGLAEPSQGASAAGSSGMQLTADAEALERARAELVRAAVQAALAQEAPPTPAAQNLPPPTEEPREPAPDHSERKAIEGLESEVAPEETPEAAATPVAEDVAASDAPEPAPEPRPSERERDRLQERLRDVAQSGGHLTAAWKRFEAQAEAQRDPRRGAAGSERGLPQLYVLDLPRGRALISYLELFGGEVLAHVGGERFVHFERTGERFEPRVLTRAELDRLAVARGLNLGYAHALDDVMEQLPEPLRMALASARPAHEDASGTWRVFVLGTTREQAAVAAAAQEHLRHHRDEAPAARLWSELERIEFRYLCDEREQIYGVHVDAVHGAR